MAYQVEQGRWTQPDAHMIAEWIDEQERTDRMFAPFGRRLLDQAALVPGERVLDIGCGTGSIALAAWERVAPGGSVTGVDISPTMLEAARARAAARGLQAQPEARITWLQTDAETYPFETGAADVAISRFGVAHVAHTLAAFKNIHRALRPGGRFVFAEWTSRAQNEWMSLADDVAGRVLPELFGAHKNAAEHSSEFADEPRLRALLEQAGFDIETFQRHTDDLWVGSSPADVLAWFARLPEGQVLDALDAGRRQTLLDALRSELERRTRIDGVYLAGSAWVVECHVPQTSTGELAAEYAGPSQKEGALP